MAWTRVDNQGGSAQGLRLRDVLLSEEAATRDKVLDFDADVAEGKRLQLLSVRVELTTDNLSTARRIQLQVKDSGGSDVVRQFEFIPTFSTASSAKVWEAAIGVIERDDVSVAQVALPSDFMLLPGQTLEINEADNRDVDDTLVVHVWARLLS